MRLKYFCRNVLPMMNVLCCMKLAFPLVILFGYKTIIFSHFQNNGQFYMERKYGTQLEGIHFSYLDTTKTTEETLDGLQSQNFNDQKGSQAMFKDCDNHMPRREGLAIDGFIQNLEKKNSG